MRKTKKWDEVKDKVLKRGNDASRPEEEAVRRSTKKGKQEGQGEEEPPVLKRPAKKRPSAGPSAFKPALGRRSTAKAWNHVDA